jgi:hypothetical protein
MKKSMMSVMVLVGLPWLGLASSAIAADQPKVAVFVKAAGSADGFTDPDKSRTDSVKNLRDKLKDEKWAQLVDSEDAAVILLEVLNRRTDLDQAHVVTAMVGGFGQKHSTLTVRLTAGTFTTELSGTGGASGVFSGYGKAAGKVVDELEKWVKDNSEKLHAIAATK